MLEYLVALIIMIAAIVSAAFISYKIWKVKDERKYKKLNIIASVFSISIVFCMGVLSAYISYQANEISQRMEEIEEERLILRTSSVAKISSNVFKIDETNNDSSINGGLIEISSIGEYWVTGLDTYIYYICIGDNYNKNLKFILKKVDKNLEIHNGPELDLTEFQDISDRKNEFIETFLEEIDKKHRSKLEEFIKDDDIKIFRRFYDGMFSYLAPKEKAQIWVENFWDGDDKFFICLQVRWNEGENYAIYYFEKP